MSYSCKTFIAISTGKVPEWAALGLLLLIPLRPVIIRLLSLYGHGELCPAVICHQYAHPVDDNDSKLEQHFAEGRRVVAADASDPAFWAEVDLEQLDQVMLALTNHEENKVVGKLLRELGYKGLITAIVRFREEGEELKKYDISSFNMFAEADTGFAEHANATRPDTGLNQSV